LLGWLRLSHRQQDSRSLHQALHVWLTLQGNTLRPATSRVQTEDMELSDGTAFFFLCVRVCVCVVSLSLSLSVSLSLSLSLSLSALDLFVSFSLCAHPQLSLTTALRPPRQAALLPARLQSHRPPSRRQRPRLTIRQEAHRTARVPPCLLGRRAVRCHRPASSHPLALTRTRTAMLTSQRTSRHPPGPAIRHATTRRDHHARLAHLTVCHRRCLRPRTHTRGHHTLSLCRPRLRTHMHTQGRRMQRPTRLRQACMLLARP
jgi:hypothetical protein